MLLNKLLKIEIFLQQTRNIFFWGMFQGTNVIGAKKKPSTQKSKKTKLEENDKKLTPQQKHEDKLINNLFDTQAFKSCGNAYVIQFDKIIRPERKPDPTDLSLILQRIETHPTLKNFDDDPMPPFETVEKRMIDLCDRKLHPLYKWNQSTPKKKIGSTDIKEDYRPLYETATDLLNYMPSKKEDLEAKNFCIDLKFSKTPWQIPIEVIDLEKKHVDLKEEEKKAAVAKAEEIAMAQKKPKVK